MRDLGPACGTPATGPGARPGPGRTVPAAFVSTTGPGAFSAPPLGAHAGTGVGNGKRLEHFWFSSEYTTKVSLTSPGPATGPGYQPPGCPGQRPRRSRAPRVPNNPLRTSESRRRRRRPASREAALFPGSGGWRTHPARVLGARSRRRARAPPDSQWPGSDTRGAPGAGRGGPPASLARWRRGSGFLG